MKNNCEKYFMMTKQEIFENLENFSKKNILYKENIVKVESLYERLKEYEVSPSLNSKNITNLQNFFKKENVEKWKNKFEKIQSLLKFKIKLILLN